VSFDANPVASLLQSIRVSVQLWMELNEDLVDGVGMMYLLVWISVNGIAARELSRLRKSCCKTREHLIIMISIHFFGMWLKYSYRKEIADQLARTMGSMRRMQQKETPTRSNGDPTQARNKPGMAQEYKLQRVTGPSASQ
jgi:hypothetical protein